MCYFTQMPALTQVDLARAIVVATNAHGEQLDKSGKPYILHPIRVMQKCEGHGVVTQIVAILHDVVEDTPVTLDSLKETGFPEEVVDAVDAISRRDGEEYFAYVERCSKNPSAALVKIADLEDNSDPVRKFRSDGRVLERYARARRMVEAAIRARGQEET